MDDDERGQYAREFGAVERPSRRGRQAVDALGYAVAVTLTVAAVVGVLSLALGAGLNGVKYGLFVVGILLFGVATLKLRPTAPYSDARNLLPTDSGEESGFQAAVQGAIPARYRLSPDERVSDALKLFLASVLVLAVSFVMERVFGVAVPGAS
ncbi:DUF7555 family protein [Halomarina litorea]|uniref:DUF7555 family protein n=1 Tax=Halomarina litorea TaxID=2961595 RepID=UPI0020C20799|nr:hypothetical protein [Halomarina sp. BCD28]